MTDAINRIRTEKRFDARTGEYPVEMYIRWAVAGELDFNANYQRGYVWGEEEQQQFLSVLISGFPVGAVALARPVNWEYKDAPFIEVVDGKQRLMTIHKFVTNNIPIRTKHGELYWRDLTRAEKLSFGNQRLPSLIMDDVPESQRVDYFIAVNFTGVPQSPEHKEKVLQIRRGIKEK